MLNKKKKPKKKHRYSWEKEPYAAAHAVVGVALAAQAIKLIK